MVNNVRNSCVDRKPNIIYRIHYYARSEILVLRRTKVHKFLLIVVIKENQDHYKVKTVSTHETSNQLFFIKII